MSQPTIQIRHTGGTGVYWSLTDFDAINSSITFARPDPYTHEFLGEWPGHRLAIVNVSSHALVRFISFFPVWSAADLSLKLVVKTVNLDGTESGSREVHQLVKKGDTFVFHVSTEPGLSYTVTRTA